jgi:hypothetical protein
MPIFKLHGFFKLMSLNMYQKFQVKAFWTFTIFLPLFFLFLYFLFYFFTLWFLNLLTCVHIVWATSLTSPLTAPHFWAEFFFFGSTGVWTQELRFAKQVLYHLNQASSTIIFLLKQSTEFLILTSF